MKEELQNLIAQIADEDLLAKCLKSLQKAHNGEGNDWEKLAELREDLKQRKMELDKTHEIISFQLGSPLNTLQMLSDMLMKSSEQMSKEQVMEFNEHLHAQIGKVQNLLGNMIQWSDLQVRNYAFKPKQFDMTALAERVFEQYESQAMQKRIQYKLSISGKLEVYADEAMLERALGNLISNAIKFTKPEGSVKGTITGDGKGVNISISDEGIGMSAAKLKNIFNPGRKSNQKGTANESGLGMGLIVAKELIALHNTSLELSSEQGKGTTASFSLPKEESQAPS